MCYLFSRKSLICVWSVQNNIRTIASIQSALKQIHISSVKFLFVEEIREFMDIKNIRGNKNKIYVSKSGSVQQTVSSVVSEWKLSTINRLSHTKKLYSPKKSRLFKSATYDTVIPHGPNVYAIVMRFRRMPQARTSHLEANTNTHVAWVSLPECLPYHGLSSMTSFTFS